ncbi:MAG: 3-methyl-2-oxobutanoate dehydrogenase (2-methylpropanoyl-transferring) [Anaeromyxobacteraceae bacterium]|nr:3-methyl-2-oxobutanoate dehydrogenase (2-methylpropanoyl-transferring) [Anaeromyxobacteraceae bacterium]
MRRVRDIEEARKRKGSLPGGSPGAGRWEREFPLRAVIADDGSADPADVTVSDEQAVDLYRWMLLSREMDERMVQLQRQGRIAFYIGAIGEEATVLGTVAGMEERDWLFPSYREHAGALFRGMPLVTFVCDLLGNAGDRMLGHQMPCHEAWAAGHFVSISAPIATQVPQAVGAAWAARIRGDDMVALTWFGEGATSANDFHTGANFAGVHKVPVIMACRNNGWAISVPRELQTASETIAQKAIAYGIHGERVDGNDLLAVHAATRRARVRAAAGQGPTLLECVTYRVEGHSTSDDPRAYRGADEVEAWRARDPILRLARYLAWKKLVGPKETDAFRAEVRERVRRAVEEAEAFAPKPALETLFEGVYAEPLWQQREQLEELRAAVASDPRTASPR